MGQTHARLSGGRLGLQWMGLGLRERLAIDLRNRALMYIQTATSRMQHVHDYTSIDV